MSTKLAQIEIQDNFIVNQASRDLTIQMNNNLDITQFRQTYLHCPVCEKLFETAHRKPLTLDCYHTICELCMQQPECPICLTRFNVNDKYYSKDSRVLCILTKTESIISLEKMDIVNKLEAFFSPRETAGSSFDAVLTQARHSIEEESARLVELIEKRVHQVDQNQIETSLSKRRTYLLRAMDDWLQESLSKSRNGHSCHSKLCFQSSSLTLAEANLVGDYRFDSPSCINKIKFLHLNSNYMAKSFNLQSSDITQPQIQITGFNWLRQAPKADFLIPYSLQKVFYIYPFNAGERVYRFKIAKPVKIENEKRVEYQFCFKMKLEYCRFDFENDRVAFFFEKFYDKEYWIKMYSFRNMQNSVCAKKFDYFVENILFKEGQTVSWSSLNPPFIRFHSSHDLKDLPRTTSYDPVIFGKYYTLADCSNSYLVFHNQDTIGIVCKKHGTITHEINTRQYEDEDDFMINEVHQQRMRLYMSQSKTEYFNMKCFESDKLIVSTWSKIYVFDMCTGALLAKNNIHLIPNNNWFLPNKLYVAKNGRFVFFDPSTSFLTYI